MRQTNIRSINYYKIGEDILHSFTSKKTLCMQTCCAPCACFPLQKLIEYFDITLYYNNSNIYPSEEYYRRRDELLRYVEIFNKEHNANVKVIVPTYDNENYNKKLEPYKDEPECGKRCHLCYYLRMNEAYEYANNHNFDYFTTVMTISRQKDPYILNLIGQYLEKQYDHTKYLYHIFKKNKGIDIGQEISEQHNLYRQDYCGCVYSYKNHIEKEKRKHEK